MAGLVGVLTAGDLHCAEHGADPPLLGVGCGTFHGDNSTIQQYLYLLACFRETFGSVDIILMHDKLQTISLHMSRAIVFLSCWVLLWVQEGLAVASPFLVIFISDVNSIIRRILWKKYASDASVEQHLCDPIPFALVNARE